MGDGDNTHAALLADFEAHKQRVEKELKARMGSGQPGAVQLNHRDDAGDAEDARVDAADADKLGDGVDSRCSAGSSSSLGGRKRQLRGRQGWKGRWEGQAVAAPSTSLLHLWLSGAPDEWVPEVG